jgi:hypothetical protein
LRLFDFVVSLLEGRVVVVFPHNFGDGFRVRFVQVVIHVHMRLHSFYIITKNILFYFYFSKSILQRTHTGDERGEVRRDTRSVSRVSRAHLLPRAFQMLHGRFVF